MRDKQPNPAQSDKAVENSAQESPSVAASNSSCSICREKRLPPPCKHGAQSGGGISEEKADESNKQTPTNLPGQRIDTAGAVAANAVTQAIDAKDLGQQSQLTGIIFNPEIISDLLSKNFLLIDNNRDSGILTIKLQCNLKSEEQINELKKFVGTILEELDAFKQDKGISANCVTIDKDNTGNFLSLRINLPTPNVYDAFIQQLASKLLLPTQNIEQKENVVYEENRNHFNPTPLSMKPSPAAKSTKDEKQEEEQSSSNRPR